MSVVKSGARTTPVVFDALEERANQLTGQDAMRARLWLTEEGVQDLHGRGRLGPFGEFADAEVDRLRAGLDELRDGPLEDEIPGGSRGGIVEDQVAVLDGGRGRLLGRCTLGGRHDQLRKNCACRGASRGVTR